MESEAKAKIHPLIATAAVAVIVLSVAGVAAITGYLPGTSAQKQAAEPPAAALTAPAAAPAATPAAPKARPAQPKVAASSAAKQPPVVVAAAAPTKQLCTDCGTVTGVSEVEVKGEGSGLGAVAGGVAGAVVGNQVGSGGTRTIARIAGAAGGAYAGHQIEKHARTHKRYDVGVKMEDGSLRTVTYDAPPTWRAGDRVRIVNGTLELAR